MSTKVFVHAIDAPPEPKPSLVQLWRMLRLIRLKRRAVRSIIKSHRLLTLAEELKAKIEKGKDQ